MLREPASIQIAETEIRGVHAGAIVLLGIGAANIGNYVFHVVSARALGPAAYSDVATLTAMIGLIALPLGGVQIFVARYAAGCVSGSMTDRLVAFTRQSLRYATFAGLVATALLMIMSPLAVEVLSIDSLWAIILTALIAIPSFFAVVLLGLAQGLQRFPVVALGLGLPPLARIVLIAGLVFTGYSVEGAMGATLVSSMIAVFILAALLWPLVRAAPSPDAETATRQDAYELIPVVLGLLSIASLSTIDLVFAKSAFQADLAGAYGAGSLIGRVILYLPAAIVIVLLPKVAARATAKRASFDILSGSLVITAAFCGLALTVFAVAPERIVGSVFGSGYEDAVPLLWLFGIAMSVYALLSVLLTYHLGSGDWRMSWLLVAGAVVELLGFVALHDTPRQLLAVSIVVGTSLLLIHELTLDPSLKRGLYETVRFIRQLR